MLLEAVPSILSSYYSYSNVMIAATTIALAFFLLWFVGANGFASLLNKQEVKSLRKSLEDHNNSIKRGWQDLAPPFNQQSSHETDEWKHEQEDVTHFCFLVHGHRGYSKVRANESCVVLRISYPQSCSFLTCSSLYLLYYRTYRTYKQKCSHLQNKKSEDILKKLESCKTLLSTTVFATKARQRMVSCWEVNDWWKK